MACGLGRHPLQPFDQIAIGAGRFGLVALQFVEHLLDTVDGGKDERDGLAGDRRAVAEIAHQCFGGMRQRFEPRQCKKATGPFNRVNEAKDVAENLGVVRILLEANQLCIDNIKAFARLREKFAQQFVHELGLSAQHAKERTGCHAPVRLLHAWPVCW